MPRVTIDLPASFRFSTETPIYASHINQSRHLDSVALLSLFAEARTRFFAALGWTVRPEGDVRMILADTAVSYRSEAFYGDILLFELEPQDLNHYGFDLAFRATGKLDGREIARGKAGMLFFDPRSRKPVAMPAEFRARLA